MTPMIAKLKLHRYMKGHTFLRIYKVAVSLSCHLGTQSHSVSAKKQLWALSNKNVLDCRNLTSKPHKPTHKIVNSYIGQNQNCLFCMSANVVVLDKHNFRIGKCSQNYKILITKTMCKMFRYRQT